MLLNKIMESSDIDKLLDQKIGDLEFKEENSTLPEDTLYAHRSEFGSITVLDRMTGFGHRDIETGFKDKNGKFWLASGHFSIRWFPELTVREAIVKIKENANTCVGV